MPCTSVFDAQDRDYRRAVLPDGIRRVAIEAGVSDPWRKYVGLEGIVIGLDRFGESAPAGALFEHFGFTADRVADAAATVLAENARA
jgi:transketolase